jgi:hypothetical protein
VAKEVCALCGAKIPVQSFCPRCGQPTKHISAQERILWELSQWQGSRGAGLVQPEEILRARPLPPSEIPVVAPTAVLTPPPEPLAPRSEPVDPARIVAVEGQDGGVVRKLRRGKNVRRTHDDAVPETHEIGPEPAEPAAFAPPRPSPAQVPTERSRHPVAPAASVDVESGAAALSVEVLAEPELPARTLHVVPPPSEPVRALQPASRPAPAPAPAPARTEPEPDRSGLELRPGEVEIAALRGWSGLRPARIVLTNHRVALIRPFGKAKWIPLDHVESTRKMRVGVARLLVDSTIEVITFYAFGMAALTDFQARTNVGAALARRRGAVHDAEIMQEWVGRTSELWDSHTGRLRVWLRKHPILAVSLITAVTALIQVYSR